MMMTARAPQLPLSSPVFAHHRRAPSAPVAVAVVVAPTKVPGLLSLSKPARSPAKQQQQPRQRSPRAPKAAAATTPQRLSPVPAPKQDEPQQQTQSTDKAPRGRQNAPKAAAKQPRSSSNVSPAPARRIPNHFASPAEARPRRQPTRAASFQAPPPHDPFLVAKEPVLSARPTGKLARRRRGAAPDSPTPARAVPAAPARAARHALSRSVPDTVQFGGRRTEFPVCDDLSDAEDTATLLFPATPRKGNPLAAFDAPAPAVHTPCAGVFDMSSDEDAGTPGDERAQLLFGLMPVSPKSARHARARAQQIKDDFFANSQFQNSPDPEDLPAPAF